MKILKTSIILIVFNFVKAQLFYPDPPSETSQTSTSEQTNVISLDTIYSFCKCNLIPGTCDPFCCCDPNCSDSYNQYQESTLNRACGGLISDFSDTCFTNSYIYKVNLRKGIQIIPSQDSTNTCIRGGQISSEEFISVETISESEINGLRIQAEIVANQSVHSVKKINFIKIFKIFFQIFRRKIFYFYFRMLRSQFQKNPHRLTHTS